MIFKFIYNCVSLFVIYTYTLFVICIIYLSNPFIIYTYVHLCLPINTFFSVILKLIHYCDSVFAFTLTLSCPSSFPLLPIFLSLLLSSPFISSSHLVACRAQFAPQFPGLSSSLCSRPPIAATVASFPRFLTP